MLNYGDLNHSEQSQLLTLPHIEAFIRDRKLDETDYLKWGEEIAGNFCHMFNYYMPDPETRNMEDLRILVRIINRKGEKLREKFKQLPSYIVPDKSLKANIIKYSVISADKAIYKRIEKKFKVSEALLQVISNNNPQPEFVIKPMTENYDNILKSTGAFNSSHEWLYLNRKIYKEYPTAPPTECKNKVLRLEASSGCPNSDCTFCIEKGEYSYKDMESFEEHFNRVERWVNNNFGSKRIKVHYRNFQRVFLSNANSLSIPYDTLLPMTEFISDKMGMKVRNTNQALIRTYASTQAINGKTKEQLAELSRNGLRMVYWGVESGNNNLLNYVHKGYSKDDIIRAGDKLKNFGRYIYNIQSSVMIMPGLGGTKFFEDHINDTIEVINKLEPKYLTFMTIKPWPGTEYDTIMTEDVDNRPLHTIEELSQIQLILQGLERFKCKIGCYYSHKTPLSNNPIDFNFHLYHGEFPHTEEKFKRAISNISIRIGNIIRNENPYGDRYGHTRPESIANHIIHDIAAGEI